MSKNSPVVFQNKNLQVLHIKDEKTTSTFINLYLCPSLEIAQPSQIQDELERHLNESKNETTFIVADRNCFEDEKRLLRST